MELRIDFYSAQEVSVRVDLARQIMFPQDESNELFWFTAFSLRQFSNLGRHPVSTLLAVLLTTFDPLTTQELANGLYTFPDAGSLGFLLSSRSVRLGIDNEILAKELMPALPELVEFHGEGRKAFIVTCPPLNLRHKGFGLLGFQVNYYAFQAVIAVFRQLAAKHLGDEMYLGNLSRLATECGELQIAAGVPMGDQAAMATAILRKLQVV